MTPCFAYGSNLEPGPFQDRCPGARPGPVAQLRGWRFRIGGAGFATVVPDSQAHVWGRLWWLSADDEARLDAYEGVAESLYRKLRLTVHLRPGEGEPPPTDGVGERHDVVDNVLVYEALDATPAHPLPDYLPPILTVARELKLPSDYLRELEAWLRPSRSLLRTKSLRQ